MSVRESELNGYYHPVPGPMFTTEVLIGGNVADSWTCEAIRRSVRDYIVIGPDNKARTEPTQFVEFKTDAGYTYEAPLHDIPKGSFGSFRFLGTPTVGELLKLPLMVPPQQP